MCLATSHSTSAPLVGEVILGELGDDDRLTFSEMHRFPNRMLEEGGHLRWNVGKLLSEIHEGMRRCEETETRLGLTRGASTTRSSTRNSALLASPYAYRDRRTEGAVKAFAEKMPLDELYRRTGIQILTFDTLFQLVAAARDEPEALGSASRLLMIGDLFNNSAHRRRVQRIHARHDEPPLKPTHWRVGRRDSRRGRST